MTHPCKCQYLLTIPRSPRQIKFTAFTRWDAISIADRIRRDRCYFSVNLYTFEASL